MEPELKSAAAAAAEDNDDRLRVKRKTLEAVLLQCQQALQMISSAGGVAVDEDDGVGADCDDVSQGSSAACEDAEADVVCVKRKTLETLIQQCQQAIEMLSTTGCVSGSDDGASANGSSQGSSDTFQDSKADLLCSLLKSRVECVDFLEKLESAQASVLQNIAEEGSSWDMVNENDLWDSKKVGSDEDDYVMVRQEDIVDGIACFMAAYLLSLKETKDLTPNQLQDALCKTFSLKKRKGKLRKAWEGSKVIYNVASWGATAIGIYQNPALLRAASAAFWTSCHVISKLF